MSWMPIYHLTIPCNLRSLQVAGLVALSVLHLTYLRLFTPLALRLDQLVESLAAVADVATLGCALALLLCSIGNASRSVTFLFPKLVFFASSMVR